MSKEIKAVFIDWNGTLSTSKFFEHLLDSNPQLYKHVQNTLFGETLGHLIEPWMVGEYNSEEVMRQLSEVINQQYEQLMEEFIYSCQKMVVSPEVIGLVDQIRAKGILVAIATDNMDSFDRWTVPALDLKTHFDSILNSYSLETRKKDFNDKGESLFFGNFLQANNLRPEETVLIDDSEDKDAVLSNYGIHYLKVEFGIGAEDKLRNLL